MIYFESEVEYSIANLEVDGPQNIFALDSICSINRVYKDGHRDDGSSGRA